MNTYLWLTAIFGTINAIDSLIVRYREKDLSFFKGFLGTIFAYLFWPIAFLNTIIYLFKKHKKESKHI